MEKIDTLSFEKIPLKKVFQILESSPDGLSFLESSKRLSKIGGNEIFEDKKNYFYEFFKRYWGPMPWLLEFSIILTIALKHYTESFIIFFLLILNSIIGFFQDRNSEKTLDLLKNKLEIEVKVLRDKIWVTLPARELIPGDIAYIKLGDIVPGDALVLEGEGSVDQSSLTGESLPKNFQKGNILFSSTIIKSGEGKIIIVNTGKNTYFGKTAELVKIAKPKSKQEQLMLSIIRYLMYLGTAASIAVLTYGIYLKKDLFSLLSLTLIFLIGSIPVALPVVLTIVQAVGASDLAQKGVLVTKFDSIEDAASIDYFCFDKTGTITENKLSVTKIVAAREIFETPSNLPTADEITALAAASEKKGVDMIDTAIISFAEERKISYQVYSQEEYKAFDPRNKKTESIISTIEGRRIKVIKGALDIILNLCQGVSTRNREKIMEKFQEFSQKGFRTLGLAKTTVSSNYHKEYDYEFLGFILLTDPLQKDSALIIKELHSMGIKTLLLTGDNSAIAREVSKEAGIGENIYQISSLYDLPSEKQFHFLENSSGFGEVYPEDKFKVIELIQKNGHLVGMTGDGVNDAPALKQANLGIAVKNSTDIAKSAASIVLTEPGFKEIVIAVKVSRETYQRMLTWVINKIIKVTEVIMVFSIGFFWLEDMVISLLGISLLVFANDFVTMTIATDNVKASKFPNNWKLKNIATASFILGGIFALEDLFIVFLGIRYFSMNLLQIQSLVLLVLVFNTQLRILIVRERRHFWSSMPSKNLLFISIATMIGVSSLAVSGWVISPLKFSYIIFTLIISIVCAVILDFIKYFIFKKFYIE